MLKLEETLKRFQDYILRGQTQIQKDITETSPLSVEGRLAIYREGYYLRLLEILEWDFSILKKYIGTELFNQLGREYIERHPSKHYSIIEYGGESFCHFLQEKGKNDKKLKPLYLELACFESLLEKVRTSVKAVSFSMDHLSSILPENWAKIVFNLNPSVQLFESRWNVPEIWQALSNDTVVPHQKKNKTESWLVWGNEGESFFCLLDPIKKRFFEAMQAGKNFGEVCEALCEVLSEAQVGEFAGSYLNQWVVDRIIVEFHMAA